MLEIEIDGKKVEVPDGSTVMEAATKAGSYIPHFCYHSKLSIAASCRMCLVQVEKAPKPLPACATPVTSGMKVWTNSEQAVKAQKGVMEFLLINHPLDCPICDQGGECQLQDLSVGYGGTSSRYDEEKRVVVNKDLGPLISTDMTRCIHCTRCVRFGQEIAGVMELGVANRGEKAEIMSFMGRTVDSELSGNSIDLCPVGALTSKPFRFSARTWELGRRKSVSPHDGLGANLVVQVKHDRVKRVLPLENEAVNECWLSDKDRFSYEGLSSEDRLTRPMVRLNGQWKEVDWDAALEAAAGGLRKVVAEHGPDAMGTLVSPHATLEELFLARVLTQGLGSSNVDFRLRQVDFSADGKRKGAPWLGMRVSEFSALDRYLVVGSFFRKDHPLLCQRVRQAVKRGAQLSTVHSVADDLAMPVKARAVVAPSRMAAMLEEIAVALAELKGASVSADVVPAAVAVSSKSEAIARSLASGRKVGVFLGNFAQQHPGATRLAVLVQEIARLAGGSWGYLGEAANSVGGYVAGAVPFSGPRSGANAREMLLSPRKAYLIAHCEVEGDFADASLVAKGLSQAECVVFMGAFRSEAALKHAHVMLPAAPFSETEGCFVNTEGRVQSFFGVVKPLEEARPGWKVLRALGDVLGLDGFALDSAQQVRAAALGGNPEFVGGLENSIEVRSAGVEGGIDGWERVADVPIYRADAIVRRAVSLQRTSTSSQVSARLAVDVATKLGVEDGHVVRVSQGGAAIELPVRVDSALASGCVGVSAACPQTDALGPMFGPISVERV